MGSVVRYAPLLAAWLLASCDGPAIDPSESLVGAKSLPSARELSRETIQINPMSSAWTADAQRLSYELRPDNSLSVTLSHWDLGGRDEVIDGRETFHLSGSVASQARRLLWRVRPEPLQGIEWIIRPTGCPPPPTDTFGDSVVFISGNPEAGTTDRKIGVFEVLPAQYCRESSANEARLVVKQVLQLFPKSKVAAEYQRRNAPRDQVIVPL